MIGLYDVHCHFLHQVDDGSKSIDESLALIKKDYQDGVRHIILTPHYRKEMFETTVEKVEKHFKILKILVNKEFPDLELLLGREYHVHMDMVELINEAPHHYCLGDSRVLLTEFAAAHSYSFIKERCYNLVLNGYVPLIAHVERYPQLMKSLDNIRELKDMGCYIQVNANSISGKSGFKTKRICTKMLKENLIDAVGTDGHNLTIRIPEMAMCEKRMVKVIGREATEYLLCHRPAELLSDYHL